MKKEHTCCSNEFSSIGHCRKCGEQLSRKVTKEYEHCHYCGHQKYMVYMACPNENILDRILGNYHDEDLIEIICKGVRKV